MMTLKEITCTLYFYSLMLYKCSPGIDVCFVKLVLVEPKGQAWN
jgi:hypothetical protein